MSGVIVDPRDFESLGQLNVNAVQVMRAVVPAGSTGIPSFEHVGGVLGTDGSPDSMAVMFDSVCIYGGQTNGQGFSAAPDAADFELLVRQCLIQGTIQGKRLDLGTVASLFNAVAAIRPTSVATNFANLAGYDSQARAIQPFGFRSGAKLTVQTQNIQPLGTPTSVSYTLWMVLTGVRVIG